MHGALDLDFADIRPYPPSTHAGVWVLRPPTQSIENTLAVLRGALALLTTETPEQRLWWSVIACIFATDKYAHA